MRVYEKLRARLLNGSTVTQIAAELQMSRPAISTVLNGAAVVSIELALKLGAVYGVDASETLHLQLDEHLNAARTTVSL